jgi:ribose/xylose/arabinose/galactoside ABC-type transport system permease subunit
MLSRTVYGRSVYATGGNAEASRLAGLPVNRVRFSTHVITTVCAGIAGVVIASRTRVG